MATMFNHSSSTQMLVGHIFRDATTNWMNQYNFCVYNLLSLFSLLFYYTIFYAIENIEKKIKSNTIQILHFFLTFIF